MTSTDTSAEPRSPRPATRKTWQRAAIREQLDSTQEFRTAQQVHEALAKDGARVGLATVYRALQTMAESGEVDTLRNHDGEMVYRACSTGHHHHLVCSECGYAVEIAATVVESWASEVGSQHGFTKVGHEVELYGLCANCA
ncbi:Fur family transcriptional regulator [Tessaracoccus caeni]|uniref:Fur family transcriptional regulator n=1 Tax=Tessaracoccus caeni TaxID=3031239 RepID=UPI0023DB405A|nr:transcriptional repressor [Tessaracoccus caeni]MDF1490160.1 transcriptional repressor [Tessaracoccus caeni]